jgi:hypothetical protein
MQPVVKTVVFSLGPSGVLQLACFGVSQPMGVLGLQLTQSCHGFGCCACVKIGLMRFV